MADLNVIVGADISNYKAGMTQAGQIAASTSSEITKDLANAAQAQTDLGGATQSTSMRFMQMRSGISAARDGVMAFTLGGQAAERSLMAMGHHINSLVNETGSFKGAMSALATSLWGPGGIILGVTVAAELFSKWRESQKKAAEAQDDFTKSLGDGVKAASDEVSHLMILYQATQNDALSRQQRLVAVKELQKEYPAYFGNLSQEAILAGKAAGAYDRLTQSLINSAVVKAGQESLAASLKPLIEVQAQLAAEQYKADKAYEAAKLKAGEAKVLADQAKQEAGMRDPNLNPDKTGFRTVSPIKQTRQTIGGNFVLDDNKDLETLDQYKKDVSEKVKANAAAVQTLLQQYGVNSLLDKASVNEKKTKVKEEVTGLDLLIQKAKEAEIAFNDAVANNAMKPGSVSESVLTQLAKQAETAREKVNEVKAAIAAIKLELARQQNIKEFGSVFPTAKPQATADISTQDKTDLSAAQADIDVEEAKKAVGAIVAANAEIMSGVQDQYDKGLIDIKTYLGQKYFLEESSLNKERSLYAEGTVQYANFTNRMTNLTKQYDAAIKKANEPTKEQIAIIKELSHVVGQGLMNAFEQALSGTQSFVKAMGQFLLQLIEKLVAAAAAAAVLAVLLSATGFGAVANFGQLFGQLSGLGGLAGGISSGGGGGSPQGFATGGIFTQPHVGMFAEAGPEAIVTPKHLADFAGVSQGQQKQTLTMKLQGSDMLLFLNRANKTKLRTS